MGYLVGDCLIAAAFLSYMGPFLSNYRDEIVQHRWMKEVSLTQNSQMRLTVTKNDRESLCFQRALLPAIFVINMYLVRLLLSLGEGAIISH